MDEGLRFDSLRFDHLAFAQEANNLFAKSLQTPKLTPAQKVTPPSHFGVWEFWATSADGWAVASTQFVMRSCPGGGNSILKKRCVGFHPFWDVKLRSSSEQWFGVGL